MWKKVAPLLIVLSVALNVAFVGIWAVRAVGSYWSMEPEAQDTAVWCPLHRRLNVTEKQWRQIEPRLKAFRQKSQSLRRQISGMRGEMIDLIAANDEPDREAIAAKQEQIRAGRQGMQQLVIEHLLAEKEVLTAEQQNELFDLLRQRSTCAGPGRMMGLSDTTQPHPATERAGHERTNPASE